MQDRYGKIVPRRLEAIFAGERQLHEVIGGLSQLQSEVVSRSGEPYMRDVDVPRVAKHIGAAVTLLGLGLPASGRCRCHPRDLDCPACHGQKWTSELSILTSTDATPP
jgi:hypothetical protein